MKPEPKPDAPLWLTIPFFVLWSSFMFSFLRFNWAIAPKALKRWEAESSFRIIERKTAGLFKRIAMKASNSQIIYEIMGLDGAGKKREGSVIVGGRGWPSMSVKTCPVVARWDEPKLPADWDEL